MVILPSIPQLCRDPEDDKVIATAIVGGVDSLLTADDDIRTPKIAAILAELGITLSTIDELLLLLG